MELRYLVLSDLEGEFWEGALVEQGPQLDALHRRGVATLPIDSSLLRGAALGCYARRAWGMGYRLRGVPQFVAPLAMLLDHTFGHLEWRARLVPEETIHSTTLGRLVAPPLTGHIRLLGDSSQSPIASAPVVDAERNRVDFARLGELDEAGGWNVGGQAACSLALGGGMFAFALHGFCHGGGLRVVWAAVSQV